MTENIESKVHCQNKCNIPASEAIPNENSKESKDISRKEEDKKNQDFHNYTFKRQAVSDILREKIVSEINDSTYCTLMADGTKDKNGREIISIAYRYLEDGKPFESLLGFVKADDLTAKGIKKLIIEEITKNNIIEYKIICQCYDGAAVMSRIHGGVQKLLQEHFNRKIPCVHCFNHRLHLFVITVVSEIDSCRLFFDQVRLLHNFSN